MAFLLAPRPICQCPTLRLLRRCARVWPPLLWQRQRQRQRQSIEPRCESAPQPYLCAHSCGKGHAFLAYRCCLHQRAIYLSLAGARACARRALSPGRTEPLIGCSGALKLVQCQLRMMWDVSGIAPGPNADLSSPEMLPNQIACSAGFGEQEIDRNRRLPVRYGRRP